MKVGSKLPASGSHDRRGRSAAPGRLRARRSGARAHPGEPDPARGRASRSRPHRPQRRRRYGLARQPRRDAEPADDRRRRGAPGRHGRSSPDRSRRDAARRPRCDPRGRHSRHTWRCGRGLHPLCLRASSPPTPVAAQRLARAGFETVDADPASKETQAANDAWVSKVTHGMITEADPAPPGSKLATFNALYFNGGWAEPFSEAKTAPADFHAANGDRLRVPFMHSGDLFSSSRREDARFVAVDLPFSGYRYSLVVLTTKDAPADLASFNDHLAGSTGSSSGQRSSSSTCPASARARRRTCYQSWSASVWTLTRRPWASWQ